jgi:hypothetical protein
MRVPRLPNYGPKGFILGVGPLLLKLTWRVTWRHFGRKDMGLRQKNGSRVYGDPFLTNRPTSPNSCRLELRSSTGSGVSSAVSSHECSFSQFGTLSFSVVSWLIAMEGTSSEIATYPMQESSHQSHTIVEREDDEDVRVIEEPLKHKRMSKTSTGKMGKTVAEVEEERGATQESSQQSHKRIEREDEEDLKILEPG